MNPYRHFTSFIITTALAAMLMTSAHGSEAETASIKFSNPNEPGTLKLTVANGDIDIQGSDTSEVTVRTELKPEGKAQRKDGLRVLTSSSSYSLVEKDNVITLSYGAGSWPSSGGDFDITVPRNTNVIISSSFGGDITIGQISGNLEVKSLNGEVSLEQVSGGALVETMNGEISADIVALKENTPLSFTSMNGEVALRLPAEAKANVRLRTHNGTILTDFDETQLVTKTASLKGVPGAEGSHAMGVSADVAAREVAKISQEVAAEAAAAVQHAIGEGRDAGDDDENDRDDEPHGIPSHPMPPLPPMTGGKIVTGTLNGGGPEIRISTMNGDVTLRKSTGSK